MNGGRERERERERERDINHGSCVIIRPHRLCDDGEKVVPQIGAHTMYVY